MKRSIKSMKELKNMSLAELAKIGFNNMLEELR